MLEARLIQLDGAFKYQQAAISAALRAFAQSHGVDFAVNFVRVHREAILAATRSHLCGRDERVVANEVLRLELAYEGTLRSYGPYVVCTKKCPTFPSNLQLNLIII